METKERLESEWCGFDGTKNVEPKSFAELPFELKTEAYQALAYLLGDPYMSKDIHRVGSARLSASDNAFFLNLLLADSIVQVAEFLRTSLRPRYAVKAEFRTAVKGRINFHKTISQSGGLLHKHFCEFPELTLNDELFGLLKIAVPHMVSKLSSKSSPELKSRLLTASYITAEATKTLPSPSNDRFHLKYATQFRPSAPVNFMQVHHPISS